jgi:hypothetical protein
MERSNKTHRLKDDMVMSYRDVRKERMEVLFWVDLSFGSESVGKTRNAEIRGIFICLEQD